MTIEKVGVIGAGQMGAGIAQVCITAGYDVLLHDASLERIKQGLDAIETGLLRRVKSGKISQEVKETIFAKVSGAATLNAFSACDLIIEAVTEKEAVKSQIYKSLGPHLKDNCIVATNTSSLSITRLAASSIKPERFIGIHFMNPVPVMELVELIRGIGTDEAVFKTVQDFVTTLGKTTAISEDFPGFIVNRILLPMINEAIYTLYEGVGNVAAIDKAMKLGAHHPMGPLELADFIGLDTCLSIMQVLHEGLSDSKYRPCPLLVKYVEAGWLGRKVNRGFYDYSGAQPVPTR